MLLVYPSILLPPPDAAAVKPGVKTLVGIKSQLEQWPGAALEPNACNEIVTTTDAIVACAAGSGRIVPLVEKTVLACALASQKLGLRDSFGLDAALCGTDRLRQRTALENTGLNPRWFVDDSGDLYFPFVAKKPASARSAGVSIVYGREEFEKFLGGSELNCHEERLYVSGYPPRYRFLAEEFIEGESWEVSGISREAAAHVFPPLQQIWTESNGRIIEYRLVAPPAGLVDAAMLAAERCGMRWCAWCIELKGHANRWKVIEVNARLGEDGKNYYRLLGGSEIANKLCEILR